ncbi:MAG: TSUP family transporter [Christensenellales bacterium]
MQYLWYIIAGLIGGIIGGMGMGGGTLLIPILTIFLKVEQVSAQLTNLISFLPMSIVAVIIHAKNKKIDFKAMLWVTIPALITACAGAYLAPLVKGDVLGRCFGGFLTILGVWMLIKIIVAKVKEHQKNK